MSLVLPARPNPPLIAAAQNKPGPRIAVREEINSQPLSVPPTRALGGKYRLRRLVWTNESAALGGEGPIRSRGFDDAAMVSPTDGLSGMVLI